MGGRTVESEVDVVRGAYEAFLDGDVARLLELVHPGVEWMPTRLGSGGRVYRGRAGVRRWLVEFGERWSERRAYVQELRDAGGGKVVVLGSLALRGAHGEAVSSPAVWVFEVSGGRIAAMRGYDGADLEDAAEAAGLMPDEPRSIREAEAVIRDSGADHVVFELADGRALEAPMLGPRGPRLEEGGPAVVVLDEEDRLVGWKLPQRRFSVDIRRWRAGR
jgi:ketosteroid isomerase-like protein